MKKGDSWPLIYLSLTKHHKIIDIPGNEFLTIRIQDPFHHSKIVVSKNSPQTTMCHLIVAK